VGERDETSRAVADLATVIETEHAGWDDPVVCRALFGTTDARAIAEILTGFVRDVLGREVTGARFYRVSVGAVAGLDLDDATSIVVKVQSGKRRRELLETFVEARRHLLRAGFPCPAPRSGPLRLGDAWATIDALDERGRRGDAHDPHVRRALAEALATLVDVGRSFERARELGPAWFSGLGDGRVFPEPHSPLFDFSRAGEGARWIDELASEARDRRHRAAGERVLGHFDWRVEHLRFEGGRVVTSYDWDSLHFERETVLVGATAHAFTMDWQRDDLVRAPSVDEIRAFVADFEAARGRPFERDERSTVASSLVYSLSYTARCNHALSPTDESANGDVRPLLRAEGRRLLDEGV
jgi:hypothetical protein